VRVSKDHNAGTNEEEIKRIQAMGGFVAMKKVGGKDVATVSLHVSLLKVFYL
jgi:hypothetical protein